MVRRHDLRYTAPVSKSPLTLRREIVPTLKLAGPVVAGQVGIMAMSIVDTAMVRSLGAQAVAAVGVGSAAYSVAFVFGMGVLFGLDRVVSVAWGAGDRVRCRDAMVQGLWLAGALSVPLSIILYVLGGDLTVLGVDEAIAPEASAYLRILAWSVPPSLLFLALRQSLQATGDVAAANVILVGCNAVNALANYVFIHGAPGMPAMGVEGAGWATLTSRLVMLTALGWWAWRRPIAPGTKARLLPDRRLQRDLLHVGVPAGLQLLAEVGIFALTTVLAGGMGAVPAAAHHVVLQVASATFMVPLGISAAGAVRVGQALGAGDPAGARRAGWTAVALGVGFMCLSALVMLTAWRQVLSPFASGEEVLAIARNLLLCAAVFQIFDGAQVSLSGVLRGAGDTRSPLLANLAGHWLIGVPVAWWTCFHLEWGVIGLWLGLASGLSFVAMTLLFIWSRRSDATLMLSPRPQS